ncbi:hypothetical protein OS493_030777 [Desmophyllum pertusum]|uniref:Uncharacterized protein n=1 Tax=Desmophyllum pertusum TaxID=174260 RepID=A0A9X0CQM8_9CNID|nr:hypothetical protein OS493_030777 [Desmophyllum pertusum]
MEGLKATGLVVLVTLGTAIAIVCFAALPLQIAMIVIGAKYKDECPVEDMIPIYLIVAGSAALFSNCCTCGIKYGGGGDQEEQSVNPLQIVAQLFLLVWFVFGNLWIYENYEPNYTDPESPEYCHKTLYLFAFWVTNSYYIIFGLVMIFMCLAGTCAAVMFRREDAPV